ncbi:CDP-alcohol phosphatidyltransferase family protein [Pseudomonadales bacterium]|nr:CDP-alcohol phosphatidyltransferase family protein [Pseudomonadales bacterium]
MKFKEMIQVCYPENKKITDRNVSVWVSFVVRPLSFYLTYAAYRLGVSANQATLVGLLVGILSVASVVVGIPVLGALLLNFFLVLDCVDGNLARLGHPSKVGEFYDALVGDFVNYSFPVAFLMNAVASGELSFGQNLNQNSLLAIIGTVVFMQLVTALASERFKTIFGNNMHSSATKNIKRVSLFEGFIRNLYGAAFLYPACLVVALFGGYDYLLLYLILSSVVFYAASIFRPILSK